MLYEHEYISNAKSFLLAKTQSLTALKDLAPLKIVPTPSKKHFPTALKEVTPSKKVSAPSKNLLALS
jgi:hypothetical protein